MGTKKRKKSSKHRVRKKSNFKTLKCSPSSKSNYSCYSAKSLNKLKYHWNQKHTKKIRTNNSYEIWKSLKDNLADKCNSEKCWLTQPFMDKKGDQVLNNYTFAPKSPNSWKKNPNEWLTSEDILNVMKQYEHEYPYFKFIGPSPIDYNTQKGFGQCVWNDLCNFSLKYYINSGISDIGIIFNTDPHYLGGAHWICLYINLKKRFIYYFDSNADKTPKEINNFINTVQSQAKMLGINLKTITNKTRHQRGDTECGIYVLYIITTLLKTNSMPIFTNRISDKDMESFRKIFFN